MKYKKFNNCANTAQNTLKRRFFAIQNESVSPKAASLSLRFFAPDSRHHPNATNGQIA